MLSWVVKYLGHHFQGESLFKLETILAVSIPLGMCFPVFFVCSFVFVCCCWDLGGVRGRHSFPRPQS